MPKTVILGAGMMGLCAADELSRRSNHEVIVLDMDNEPGGMCKGVEMRGQIFDFGPHAFWTKFQSAFEYCQKICDGDLLDLGLKDVSIHFRGKEFPYPLRIGKTLLQLSPTESLACLFSFGKAYIKNLFITPDCASFEEHIRSYFGDELYKIFFRDYTAKVWGIAPKELAASFAAERIPKIKIWQAVVDTILRLSGAKRPSKHVGKYQPSHLYYPKFGFRGFVFSLANLVKSRSVRLEMNAKVTRINTNKNRVVSVEYESNGERKTIPCDHLISTLPINITTKILDQVPREITEASDRLLFRKISLVFLVVNRPKVFTKQWVYYQDSGIYMHRVYETKAFGSGVSPNENETGLCVEVTNKDGLSEAALTKRVLADFEKLGVLNANEILESKVIELTHGYPLYDLDYKKKLDHLLQYAMKFENLITCGRQGLFVYVDTDHCMKMAEYTVDHLVDGKPLDRMYSLVAKHG